MTKRNNPVLEPTTQAFVDALEAEGGKPLYTLSYEDARKVLEDAQAISVRKEPADIVSESNLSTSLHCRGCSTLQQ
jgi:acetyl esterase